MPFFHNTNNLILMGLACAIVGLTACTPAHVGQVPATAERPVVVDINTLTAQSYNHIAERFVATGDYAGALHFYNQALALDKNNNQSYQGIARIYLHNGLTDDAARVYEYLLTRQPEDEATILALGKIYIGQSRFEEALALLDRQLKAGSTTISLYTLKGVALDMLNKHEAAQMAYADGLDRAPDNQDLLINMALSFALSDMPETAIGLLMGLADEKGQFSTPVTSNLAIVMALSGNRQAAVALVENIYNAEEMVELAYYYGALSTLSAEARTKAVFTGALAEDYSDPKTNVILADGTLLADDTLLAEDDVIPVLPAFSPEEGALLADVPAPIYWVQLGAYPSLSYLKTQWQGLAVNYNSFLREGEPFALYYPKAIKTKYRLYSSGYSKKMMADEECAKIKSLAGDCLVIRPARTPVPLSDMKD